MHMHLCPCEWTYTSTAQALQYPQTPFLAAICRIQKLSVQQNSNSIISFRVCAESWSWVRCHHAFACLLQEKGMDASADGRKQLQERRERSHIEHSGIVNLVVQRMHWHKHNAYSWIYLQQLHDCIMLNCTMYSPVHT